MNMDGSSLRALLDAQNARLYQAAKERDRLLAENRRLKAELSYKDQLTALDTLIERLRAKLPQVNQELTRAAQLIRIARGKL